MLVLTGLGWLEKKLPSISFSRLTVRCKRNEPIEKNDLYSLIHQHQFKTSNSSYELRDEGHAIQYQLIINTRNNANLEILAKTLIDNQLVTEFSITPLGR